MRGRRFADGAGAPARAAALSERPGYLAVRADGGGAYLGGLMVTDRHGLPVDFRYTDPVTPTRLQRALYGGALDRHLRRDVVLRALIEALDAAPTILIVDDAALLDEEVEGCPVVLAAPTRADPLGTPGARRPQDGGTFLLQAGSGPPIRVTPGAGAGDGEAVGRALVEMAALMDPLEPADRVREALDVIAAGDAGA